MIANFNQPVIQHYSPISSKGGKRRQHTRRYKNKRNKSNKRSKSNKSRTRRYY